jgi:hypothetical protein
MILSVGCTEELLLGTWGAEYIPAALNLNHFSVGINLK